MTGKSYVQDIKEIPRKVTFCDNTNDDDMKDNNGLECHHNLLMQTSPNPEEDVEYTMERAPLIARMMHELNQQVTMKGTSFSQQYILQVGVWVDLSCVERRDKT